MKHRFGTVNKYKAILLNHPSRISTFTRVGKELAKTRQQLKQLSKELKLFNCINNDINSKNSEYYDSNEYKTLIAMWQKFYISILPMPSQFELPVNQQNYYRYIEEYRAWKLRDKQYRICLICFIVLSSFVVIVFLYWSMRKEPRNKVYRI